MKRPLVPRMSGKERLVCGPATEHLHDDGNAFICVVCGAVARRTRDNPYPEMKHRNAVRRP